MIGRAREFDRELVPGRSVGVIRPSSVDRVKVAVGKGRRVELRRLAGLTVIEPQADRQFVDI